MRRFTTYSVAAAIGCFGAGMTGCDDGTSIETFDGYGSGMPGSGLTEGGEALLEKIFLSPGITGGEAVAVNQFHAFQYGGGFNGATMAPAPGQCFEFQHPVSFPVHDIAEDADYVDWGESVTLSGPGIDGSIEIPKTVAPEAGLTDNRPSPVRHHREGKWIYGGPAWQADFFQDSSVEEGEYTLDIGDRELTFDFPPAYDIALNIGQEEVEIPRTAPEGGWEITWESIPNPEGQFHTREHSFVFVVFAAFPGEGDLGPNPLFLCQPPDTEDGSLFVSQDVLDALPDAGIVQSGRLTHYMEALPDNDGEERRFDLFSIYCAISTFTKVDE